MLECVSLFEGVSVILSSFIVSFLIHSHDTPREDIYANANGMLMQIFGLVWFGHILRNCGVISCM